MGNELFLQTESTVVGGNSKPHIFSYYLTQ
jgi:hypothetical protein